MKKLRQRHSFSDVIELSDEDLLVVTGGKSHQPNFTEQVLQNEQTRLTNGDKVNYADTRTSSSHGTDRTHTDIKWGS